MPTLTWAGKEAVVNHHQKVPFHLLKDVPSLSVGDPGSGNLIVEGDNLVALKALLPYYAGQVKCIYIDPPYNTGNEKWVYNDNVNSPVIKKWLGQMVGDDASDLSRHDKWLCMMYPRLQLLKMFLREDGAIFISIDDNEVQSLRFMMDEIFGSQHFVECVCWNKRIPKNDAGIGNIHEYVLIYARSQSWKYEFTMKKEGLDKIDALLVSLKRNKTPIPEAEAALRKLYRDEGYERGITLYNSLTEDYRPWGKINMSWPNANSFGPRYDVLHPLTKKPVKVPERGWRWKEDTFKQSLQNGPVISCHDGTIIAGRIWFDKDERIQPSSIKYLEEVDRILLRSVLSMKSDGGIELERIFGTKSKFAYPKPTNLIQVLVASIEMSPGDIVLDSFAGSGTTGHAVLKQNAYDEIQRRFLLIEMMPEVSRDICSERLRRVSKGYLVNGKEEVKGLGGSFRYCELGIPLFDQHGAINSDLKYTELARHVYFTETGEPLPHGKPVDSPLLGISNGVAIYLLFNGILGDRRANGGNILTRAILAQLPPFHGQKIIYAAGCLISEQRLHDLNIAFRQTPYEIKVT
jgi:DNA modification methylase